MFDVASLVMHWSYEAHVGCMSEITPCSLDRVWCQYHVHAAVG